jgi:hypothetical protein
VHRPAGTRRCGSGRTLRATARRTRGTRGDSARRSPRRSPDQRSNHRRGARRLAADHTRPSILAWSRESTSVPRSPLSWTVVPGSTRLGGMLTTRPFTRQRRTSGFAARTSTSMNATRSVSSMGPRPRMRTARQDAILAREASARLSELGESIEDLARISPACERPRCARPTSALSSVRHSVRPPRARPMSARSPSCSSDGASRLPAG